MSKVDRAKDLLLEAERNGWVPTVTKNWISWEPMPPIKFVIEASEVGDELAELINLLNTTEE